MKIAKISLIEPGQNTAYATFAVALSFFVFAYSSRFGQISVLAYYGLWLPLVLVDYRRVLGHPGRHMWIFAFAGLCFLSSFWSAAPSVSLRASIQYLTHVLCALIVLRTVRIEELVKGALIGCLLVLIYSMLFGYYAYDPMDGTYSFVGAFSSKNQLGFYASLGLLFTYCSAMVLGQGLIWLGVAGLTGAISAYSILASQSATSVLTTFAILAAVAGLQVLCRFAPNIRKLIFFGGLIIGVLAIAAALTGGAADAILGLFGKDSTLTGRTYLWAQGMEAARQHPIFGIGYQAYWVQGFPDAERLWEDFYITSRSGFHFHNTYIETTVETGVVGLFILVLTLLTPLFVNLRRVLHDDRNPQALVMFAIGALLLIRSFVEIDVIFPYQIGSFLMFLAAGQIGLRRRRKHAAFPPHLVVKPIHPHRARLA